MKRILLRAVVTLLLVFCVKEEINSCTFRKEMRNTVVVYADKVQQPGASQKAPLPSPTGCKPLPCNARTGKPGIDAAPPPFKGNPFIREDTP